MGRSEDEDLDDESDWGSGDEMDGSSINNSDDSSDDGSIGETKNKHQGGMVLGYLDDEEEDEK